MEKSFFNGFLLSVLIFNLIFIFPGSIPVTFADPDAPFSTGSSKVIDDVDYIYLHIGLQVDYPLPERFKQERLKFEGTYKRYTSATYRKSKNDIRFIPKRQGSGVMVIKNKDNKIIGRLHVDVQKDNLHKVAAELRDLLVAIDGIEVRIYNKKIIIDGQVLLPGEMKRIMDVISKYDPKMVTSLVRYSPEAQAKIAKLLEEKIGLPEIKVTPFYNRFLIEGCVVDMDTDIKHIGTIANFYTRFDVSPVGGQRKVNIITMNIKPCVPITTEEEMKIQEKEESEKKAKEIKKLIQIVVHFVEMSKKFEKGFLFQWAPAIGEGEGTQITASASTNPRAPTGITGTLTTVVHNFFPKLQWAKSFDFARILHNSSLLIEESKEQETRGELKIDTSVPVPRAHGEGIIMEGQSKAGIVTTFSNPKIVGERKNFVHMTINIVVTSPEEQGATSKTISTTLHIKDGTSAAIGGVISSILKRNYGTPSSQNSLIHLGASKTYSNTKEQFVVFITPIIKSFSNVDEVERIKKKFRLDES